MPTSQHIYTAIAGVLPSASEAADGSHCIDPETGRTWVRLELDGAGASWVEQLRVVVADTLDSFDGYTPLGPMLGILPNGSVKIAINNDGVWSLTELVAAAP